jgi:hypothetical protein
MESKGRNINGICKYENAAAMKIYTGAIYSRRKLK